MECNWGRPSGNQLQWCIFTGVDGIINLTISRITFSQCGELYQHENLNLPWHTGAFMLFNVFNLRVTWVEIQNTTNNAIIAVNVLGASVIHHSVFQSSNISVLGLQSNSHTSRLIYISYDKCNQNHHKCSNKTMSFLHAVNSHKLHIHNCVLRDEITGSMLYNDGFKCWVRSTEHHCTECWRVH